MTEKDPHACYMSSGKRRYLKGQYMDAPLQTKKDPETCPSCSEWRLVDRSHATYSVCDVCSTRWLVPKPDVRDINGVEMNRD